MITGFALSTVPSGVLQDSLTLPIYALLLSIPVQQISSAKKSTGNLRKVVASLSLCRDLAIQVRATSANRTDGISIKSIRAGYLVHLGLR